jgi:DNA polymerase I-like protein with 3'-5' exonuclease and polymerase domains
MSLQMAMFTPKSEWVPPAELPPLWEAKEIAIDVETKDPNLKTLGPGWSRSDGQVVGYAIATTDWQGYIPIRHLGGGNLDERIVDKWLKKVFECDADKIMHNAQYDAGWIRRMGFKINGRIVDTMVIASLLDENRFSYSLNALAYDHLNKTKSEKSLVEAARDFGVDPKAELWKLPAMHVGPYAETDAVLTLELWTYFKTLLGKEDLWPIANLELELLPCLIDMTWTGVRVDMDAVEKTRVALIKEEKDVLSEIKRMTNMDVEIWAAQSLSKAFDKMSIAYPKTEKGQPSFTKGFLSEHEDKLPRLIVKARNLNKTHGTFINTIMRHTGRDGRIHSHINQIRSDDGGTVSGRISMSNPNLTANPCPRSRVGTYDTFVVSTRRGGQVGCYRFLATGTTDLGSLCSRLRCGSQKSLTWRCGVCRRIQERSKDGLSYHGCQNGKDRPQAGQDNKLGHDVRYGR